MDLSIQYLGLKLAHPLMAGACPAFSELNTARELEAAGAAAITMYSLFEEQISRLEMGSIFYSGMYTNASAEVRSHYPKPADFPRDPTQYVAHVTALKKALKIPVIASLNCTSLGTWSQYARMIQYAGADALELNFHYLVTNPEETGQVVEDRLFRIVEAVRAATALPIALKLSPFFSSLPNIAQEVGKLGINGLVLFNRFYATEMDVQHKKEVPNLHLSHVSDSAELLLRLHWISILSSRSKLSMAITGGVHSGLDAAKAVMAGANGVQMVSALLSAGPDYIKSVLSGLQGVLERLGCKSLAEIHGSMNLAKSADPSAAERAGYLRVLQEWPISQHNAPMHTY